MDRDKVIISVIICTYNRSGLLSDVVKSIQEQDFKGSSEIIIVDNNSMDNTRDVVEELCKTSPIPVRYLFEKKQGLSHARNRGINEAQGEIIAFIDDDAVASKQWLASLIGAYDDPKVVCVGGQIRLLWPSEKPEWLVPSMESTLGSLDYGDVVKELEYPQTPFGGNISFRKNILYGVNKFSADLGRDAKTLLSNEELELCARLGREGWTIKYVPNALIYHKVSKERLKKLWFIHRYYWQGRSDGVLYESMKIPGYKRLRKAAREILWRRIDGKESKFNIKCLERSDMGFLHQLVFFRKDSVVIDGFRRLRALSVFLKEMVYFSIQLVSEREDYIKVKDEQIRQKDEQIRQKDEQIRQKEEQIRQKEEQLQRILKSKSWRVTAPLRKVENILRKYI